MDDEAEIERYHTALAQRSPYYKRKFKQAGMKLDAELPEDYDVNKVKLVRRIDALMFTGKTRTAIEIKISRADFFRDTPEKRAIWQVHTHRFIYLTPKGLVKPEEVPVGCGLWEYEADEIVATKKATVVKEPTDLPPSMAKYFAWRAFVAEQKVAALTEGEKPSIRRARRRRR
jgi:hypothetical protein